MESDNFSYLVPQFSTTLKPSVPDCEKTGPDFSKVCPLCSSVVRLFFINFNEKMLMCENIKCEFPFGHEQIKFVREDEDENSDDEEVTSVKSKKIEPSLASGMSTANWSEIDKLNHTNDLEDIQLDIINETRKTRVFKPIAGEDQIKIVQHVKDLKQLSNQYNDAAPGLIKKNTWIKKLMSMQATSGVKLLKAEEMIHLQKEQAKPQQVKIDIDTSGGISTISIDLSNQVPINSNDEIK